MADTIIGAKGNQFKYCSNGSWFKKDYLGYEALSETIVSFILSKSNVSSFCKYSIVGDDTGIYSKSENFLRSNSTLITLQKLVRLHEGSELHEKMLEFDEVEDKIKYTSDIIVGITGLKEFSKYLTLILELDALTLDDDRHFNNIAVIFDGTDYYLPPLFDFGASFLSDTMIDYPLSSDLDKLLEIKNAKPFSSDFNEQVDVAESLYGTQLKVHTTASEVCSYVDSIGNYSQEIKTRVKTLIRYAFRKYRYLLGSNGMKNLTLF